MNEVTRSFQKPAGFKTCPVCQSRCFDDMAVCYGCLYRFPQAGEVPSVQASSGADLQKTAELCVSEPQDRTSQQGMPVLADTGIVRNAASPQGTADEQSIAGVPDGDGAQTVTEPMRAVSGMAIQPVEVNLHKDAATQDTLAQLEVVITLKGPKQAVA